MTGKDVSKYRALVKGMVNLALVRTITADSPDAITINLGVDYLSNIATHSISLELQDTGGVAHGASQVTITGIGRATISAADITALEAALGVVIDVTSTYRNIVFAMQYPDYPGGERVYDVVVTNQTISLYGKTLTDAVDETIEYFISPCAENETLRDGTGTDLSGLPALNEPPYGGPAFAYLPGVDPVNEIQEVLYLDGTGYILGGPGLGHDLEIIEYGFQTAGQVIPGAFTVISGDWGIIGELSTFIQGVDAGKTFVFNSELRAKITENNVGLGFNSGNSSFRYEFFKRSLDYVNYIIFRKENDGTHSYRLEIRNMAYLAKGGVKTP